MQDCFYTNRYAVNYLFGSKFEPTVHIFSTVYFTIGAFLDEVLEDILSPFFVFWVHRLNFLSGRDKQVSLVQPLFKSKHTEASRPKQSRTYFMIKNESLIANRVSFRELVFVFPSLPLHFFEKWPCVAWIPLTDKASEPSKGQWAVSHTAKRVWAAVVLIWPNTGEVTQNWPVQRGTAWAFVVNLLAVKRSPSGVFLWAFKAATARGTEIASLFNRRVPLQEEEEGKKSS